MLKCETCNINNAQVRDYRRTESGYYDKYLVCPNCFMLNDRWFFKLKYAKEKMGKKRIMAQITDGTWRDYIID